MTRVKRGYVARRRRKKILHLTSGFYGAHSRLFRVANQKAIKALAYSHIDRAKRKRNMRSLWICRINAVAREQNISYSYLIKSLKEKKILLNRKMLAQLAVLDKPSFIKLINTHLN